MGGSCSMPFAAHATIEDGVLQLHAAWGDPEGEAVLVRAQATQAITDLPSSEALGLRVAQDLRLAGAH
jgi:hydroxymethylbilane synthase